MALPQLSHQRTLPLVPMNCQRCVEAESAEAARALLARGEGHCCHFGRRFPRRWQHTVSLTEQHLTLAGSLFLQDKWRAQANTFRPIRTKDALDFHYIEMKIGIFYRITRLSSV